MNFLNRIFQSLGRRAFAMESMEDYLYYSHEKLVNYIQKSGDEDLGVQEYLKNVKYAPIPDFKKGTISFLNNNCSYLMGFIF